MDIYPPSKQRPALLALLAAINASPKALRRDDCGDWRINGKSGHIYAVPGTLDAPGRPGFLIYFDGSARAWGYAKQALSFARVTQDGDADGFLFLDRLPTLTESEVIRDKIGIRKRRELDDAALAALRARFSEQHVAA